MQTPDFKTARFILTDEQADYIFHIALCNEGGCLSSYGIELDYSQPSYKASKEALLTEQKESCYEDVLLRMLQDGGTLTAKDIEGEGSETETVSISKIREAIRNVVPMENIINIIQEEDDAGDADVILQYCFWGKMIFS
jgi:hypothetical protein